MDIIIANDVWYIMLVVVQHGHVLSVDLNIKKIQMHWQEITLLSKLLNPTFLHVKKLSLTMIIATDIQRDRLSLVSTYIKLSVILRNHLYQFVQYTRRIIVLNAGFCAKIHVAKFIGTRRHRWKSAPLVLVSWSK